MLLKQVTNLCEHNKSFKRDIILFKQINDFFEQHDKSLNEILSCLNKINNLFERHIKSFKRVIMLLNIISGCHDLPKWTVKRPKRT